MQSINSVQLPANWNQTIPTGYDSFDELLGNDKGVNGARYGRITLLSAQSGTGKTRLCIQVLDAMTKLDSNLIAAHATGEQSENAIAAIAASMGIETVDNFLVTRENHWEQIMYDCIRKKVKVLVIDSYPMLTFDKVDNKKLDTKEKLEKISKFAEDFDVHVILLNHTDKAGNRAGRNELMHLVDVAYTMHKAEYDGIKVIEFHNDKNREGVPVSRAFPFNGVWDLSAPFEIEESEGGKSAAPTGVSNESKVAARKKEQWNAALRLIQDMNGVVERRDVENGTFEIDGMIPSAIMTMFRVMTDNGILDKVGNRPIIRWNKGENFQNALDEIE